MGGNDHIYVSLDVCMCFVIVNYKGGCIGSSLNVFCLTVKCQIFAMFGVYINFI